MWSVIRLKQPRRSQEEIRTEGQESAGLQMSDATSKTRYVVLGKPSSSHGLQTKVCMGAGQGGGDGDKNSTHWVAPDKAEGRGNSEVF